MFQWVETRHFQKHTNNDITLSIHLAPQLQVVAGKHNLFIEEPEQQVANVQVSNISFKVFVFLAQKYNLETSCQGDKDPPRLGREQHGRRHLSDWAWVAFCAQLSCWICKVLPKKLLKCPFYMSLIWMDLSLLVILVISGFHYLAKHSMVTQL